MNFLIQNTLQGSLFEIPVEGGEVGDLNAKIIGDQFQKLKSGDRFFYTHARDEDDNVPGLGEKVKKNVWRYLYYIYKLN